MLSLTVGIIRCVTAVVIQTYVLYIKLLVKTAQAVQVLAMGKHTGRPTDGESNQISKRSCRLRG